MLRIADAVRCALPVPVVRQLPARRRRRHILLRVAHGRIGAAARIARGRDPFEDGALWKCVDQRLEEGAVDRLPELRPLAELRPAFDQAVFAALCLVPSQGVEAARAALDDLGDDHRFEPFLRMCARAWSAFLAMPRFQSDGGSTEEPTLIQFWDNPQVPKDVTAAIDTWRALLGPGCRLMDEPAAREFLTRNHGATAARAFDLCPHPAIKADYFRLGYLAVHGGMWIDADEVPQPGFLTAWRSFARRTVLWFNTCVGHWLNGLIVAPPGCALMQACVRDATDRIHRDPTEHPYYLAGPGLLTDTILWMQREGRLSNAVNMTTHFVRTQLIRQIQPAYKQAGGSWQSFMAARAAT